MTNKRWLYQAIEIKTDMKSRFLISQLHDTSLRKILVRVECDKIHEITMRIGMFMSVRKLELFPNEFENTHVWTVFVVENK
jgi:hypothetical protein